MCLMVDCRHKRSSKQSALLSTCRLISRCESNCTNEWRTILGGDTRW
uniref:Uncharacterized protein n=1 Tax=Parascaris univalens TaxID=6257 RepID=A0A914ZQ31_PARUN